ncbi:PREDICTED: ubinuclein-1-like isoform X3 [Lupinus angustifolius]|uniref:ubinuclein-1-like isoform X3 n=1 Tax=Lupinus angustifolius TaxID=3871 RepID=UPI00092EA7F3|nr:PREDICTED: ubinuclein-1-like isoform X3 [Lupinus angustifolius]
MAEEKKAPPSSSFVKKGDRQIFTVELRQGETTIVSWKKLMKDANNNKNNDGNHNNGSNSSSAPSHVHHALDSRIAPGQPAEVEEKDPSQPNRFSAVIEKIERLYMGKDSSDEEDIRDVHDDQYDTEDSFIDDAELDEYFEVDNSAIKHDGFFVNRGKLERINEPPVLPNQQPKKRRRKDILKNPDENNDDQGSNKHVKGSRRASGKTASLKGKNTSYSSQNLVAPGEYYKDLKVQNKSDVPGNGISSKKKTADTKSTLDLSVSLKALKDDVLGSVKEAKDGDKQKTGIIQSKKISDKYKDASGFLGASHQKYHEQGAHAHPNSQPGRSSSNINDSKNTIHSKEKKVMRELPDLNLSEEKSTMQVTNVMQKSEYTHKKDGSSVRTKTSALEKAIHELEKMVAESRPPAMEQQESDTTSQAVKRRLPREIKLKLAKVARLAQASQGKVSTELLNRLMSILGHLMQLRTLKRNLKEMISTGLSVKQEKDVRFQLIKKEVVDMIRVQALTLESKQQKTGASGDFQEFGPDGKAISKSKFSMDTTLEDKICDLYDLFVDGLDESAGPQIRKLYAELAELWPTGCMDNHGIKHGICRAKERRRALHNKHKDQEKMKRKKLLVPKPEENVLPDTSSIPPQQSSREKVASQSSSHDFTPVNKPVSYMSTTAQVPSPMNDLKQEKARKSSSSSVDNVNIENGGLAKKKVKRKPEHDLEGAHFGPEKKPSSLMEEARPKSLKQSAALHTKSKLHPTSIPGLEQSN